MRVAIRQAQVADLQAVLELYQNCGLDSAAALTPAQAAQIWRQFARYPSYRLFAACDPLDPDLVLGSYSLLVMHKLAHAGAPAAIVEDVAVQPQRQGQGIGRQMMVHAVNQARLAGCYKLALSSNGKRLQAHAFYESLGFVRHGLSFVIET